MLNSLADITEGLFQLSASLEEKDPVVSAIPSSFSFELLEKYLPDIKGLFPLYESSSLYGNGLNLGEFETTLHEAIWLTETLVGFTEDQRRKPSSMGFYTLANTLDRLSSMI